MDQGTKPWVESALEWIHRSRITFVIVESGIPKPDPNRRNAAGRLFRVFGIPELIMSDNGAQFKYVVCNDLLAQCRI